MKDYMKKFLVTVCAISASATILTASVSAAETTRPMPGEGEAVTDQYATSEGDQADVGTVDNTVAEQPAQGASSAASSVSNVNTVTTNTSTNTTSTTSNKKYLTRMGGFLWFLLSVVVNFIISFWLGNRFYNMARKSAQSSNEIRALRKDIEEKFASSLNDISEPTIDVLNQNENYARSDEGLAMPTRKARVELSDEEKDMMRRWDKKRTGSSKSASVDEDIEEYDDEDDDDYDDRASRGSSKRSYQPTRRSSGIDFEDEDDYEDDYDDDDDYDDRRSSKKRPSRMSSSKKSSKSKSKGRRFLNNVLPYDED